MSRQQIKLEYRLYKNGPITTSYYVTNCLKVSSKKEQGTFTNKSYLGTMKILFGIQNIQYKLNKLNI